MNLIDYIKGSRRGKDSNRLEREALDDPFLSEALEGFDNIPGNHIEDILNLQKRVRSHPRRNKSLNPVWKGIAASALLVFGFGGYILVDSYRSDLSAKEAAVPEMIEVFVPEEVFVKHEATIKVKNISAQKVLEAQIAPFKVQGEIDAVISDEEIGILTRDRSIIDIYVPDQTYSKNEVTIAKSNSKVKIISASADSVISIYVPEKDFGRIKAKAR